MFTLNHNYCSVTDLRNLPGERIWGWKLDDRSMLKGWRAPMLTRQQHPLFKGCIDCSLMDDCNPSHISNAVRTWCMQSRLILIGCLTQLIWFTSLGLSSLFTGHFFEWFIIYHDSVRQNSPVGSFTKQILDFFVFFSGTADWSNLINTFQSFKSWCHCHLDRK